MKFRNIILSYDFVLASITTLFSALFIPSWIKGSFAAAFYNTGLTVLSIIFSLFFAASAIIMSSTDNEFIKFLEERKQFSRLMHTFKFTLIVLFISLIYSIVLWTCTDYVVKEYAEKARQHKVFFSFFQFLFSYSLLAAALSVMDTIAFTKYRTKFLSRSKDNTNNNLGQ
jgi:ABC-type uncharacterized transport system fused permease/ATPase subunit